LLDISGQARPAAKNLKDIGCDEYTTGAVANRPLKLSDVGPVYLRGPVTAVFGGQMIKTDDGIPVKAVLQDCFPNPFNPTTTIQFSVPTDGKVVLKLLNAVGQEIALLYNNEAESGRAYRIKFDASALSSGMYISHLEFNGKILSKKILFLK